MQYCTLLFHGRLMSWHARYIDSNYHLIVSSFIAYIHNIRYFRSQEKIFLHWRDSAKLVVYRLHCMHSQARSVGVIDTPE